MSLCLIAVSLVTLWLSGIAQCLRSDLFLSVLGAILQPSDLGLQPNETPQQSLLHGLVTENHFCRGTAAQVVCADEKDGVPEHWAKW
jgi:hypothetical protein